MYGTKHFTMFLEQFYQGFIRVMTFEWATKVLAMCFVDDVVLWHTRRGF